MPKPSKAEAFLKIMSSLFFEMTNTHGVNMGIFGAFFGGMYNFIDNLTNLFGLQRKGPAQRVGDIRKQIQQEYQKS